MQAAAADRWAGISSSLVADLIGPAQILDPAIQPQWRPIHLVGPVFTVRMEGGDNLALHRALESAPAESVLVAIAETEVPCGIWGEIMTLAARRRGIRGLVTNAWVRDYGPVKELGFPVFARGLHIGRAQKEAPGVLGQPVEINGLTVSAGDWIVGDNDGLVHIPAGRLDDIETLAGARQEWEESIKAAILAGQRTLDVLNLRNAAQSRTADT